MKQILTYISPDKQFNKEHQMAVKIQIDNSLSLGWKREDILLVTNFVYTYNGVMSIMVGDENYCQHFFPATKIYVIDTLFKAGLIDDLYWYHDFDCFQLNPFGEIKLGDADMGLTQYGRMPRLCSSSIFFKPSAKDIFALLRKEIEERKIGEEEGTMRLRFEKVYQERIKLLDITYAFQKWNMWHCWNRAQKPIKAVHFHLTPDKYDFYINGNNEMHLLIIPERLVDIFHKHGFKYETGDHNTNG